MSQSVPSYRPGQAHRLEYKEIAKSLHPSREKGQKSSFKRLTNLTGEIRKNKSRCSLSSSMSCSEEDSSSRESFMSSDMEGINITSDRQEPNHYSRFCQNNFSYEPKISRTKKVSFMIGDELLEEELGEDAFHHDYNTSIRNDNYEYEDSIEFPYNADDSWRDIKFLADQLESQVSELFQTAFGETYSLWALRRTLNLAIADLVNLSEEEPYGVKGANIIVKFSKLQDKPSNGKEQDSKMLKQRRSSSLSTSSISSDQFDAAETLGNFQMCKNTVSTFELILSLKEEKRQLGLLIRNWLSPLTGSKKVHVISPEFSLTKRKLYRMTS